MDHIKEIKEIVAEEAYEQLKHNLEHVDTHELGEVIDMIKDMSEAAYYCSVVEAMEKAEEEEKRGGVVYFTEPYSPMYREDRYRPKYMGDRVKYYDESGTHDPHSGARKYHDGDRWNMPYYDYQEPVARDMREGRSPISRRRYMESKEMHHSKEVSMQELEKYMAELSKDMTEMITDSTPEEKQMLHKKLMDLTDKIAALK